MIEIYLVESLIIGLPLWIIFRCYKILKIHKNKEKFSFFKEFTTNIFALYIYLLINITLLPLYINGPGATTAMAERIHINIIPFNDYITGSYTNVNLIKSNLIGNIILLIPFIFYLCLMKENIRNIKSVVITSFLISLFIESFQFITNLLGLSGWRAVDIDDLILNTLGGIIAYLIFKIIYRGRLKRFIDKTYK